VKFFNNLIGMFINLELQTQDSIETLFG